MNFLKIDMIMLGRDGEDGNDMEYYASKDCIICRE